MSKPKLLSVTQTAEYLDVSPGTLQNWRSSGSQLIPWVMVGAKVMYREEDLNEWIESRMVTTTTKGGKISD